MEVVLYLWMVFAGFDLEVQRVWMADLQLGLCIGFQPPHKQANTTPS